MKKIAAVDLGTNTFLCLIAEVEGKNLKVIEDVARVVRLGEKVNQNRKFLPQALARSAKSLDEFEAIIKKHNVDHVVAAATSAARDVENGQELLELGQVRNIPISIIAGFKEAELSFQGAISAMPSAETKNIFVVDVGGGSTELSHRKANEKEIKAKSFDVGCVRLTEMFLKRDPVSADELQKLNEYGLKVLRQFGFSKSDIVVAVAGTPTTLAAISQKIDFEEHKVEGYILTKEHIKELVQTLGLMTLAERKNVTGLEPLRADVIVAGGVLLLCALEVAQKNEMRVSTRGLRYGLALNYGDFL
jgi:exopolyphosphatase/guanosine-5'-triphosphate,3'-diphosphate pyrophosphatase